MKEKQTKMLVNEFEGYGVTVTIEGTIEEYAKKFLAIFNNVKEYNNLYYMENDYGNNVTVYCSEDWKDRVSEWLSGFGTVKSCNKVMLYQIISEPDYDLDTYDSAVVVPYFES